MFALSTKTSLFGLFVLLLQLTLLNATPLSPGGLEDRAAPAHCTRVEVVILKKILTKHAKSASSICSRVLNISAPTTTTSITTTTQQCIVTSVVKTTVTTTSGVRTSSATTTATSSATVTSTSLSTATTTQIIPVTLYQTSYTTSVITIPASTTTVTSTVNILNKRATPRTMGDVAPGCPSELRPIVLDLASQACSCYITSEPASTRVVTATAKARSIKTITTTVSTIVVPSSTTSVTSTVVVGAVSTTTTTSITTATEQSFSTVYEIVTSTTISTATGPTVTTTITVPVGYTQTYRKDSAPACVYNRYTNYDTITDSPGPNNDYAPAMQECAAICSRTSSCKFFLMYIDAQGDNGWCITDDQPYDAGFMQCNIPFSKFSVGYQKN
ncbi:hypothetical protein PMIN06_010539 [Paraphaeosphaeria minitans]